MQARKGLERGLFVACALGLAGCALTVLDGSTVRTRVLRDGAVTRGDASSDDAGDAGADGGAGDALERDGAAGDDGVRAEAGEYDAHDASDAGPGEHDAFDEGVSDGAVDAANLEVLEPDAGDASLDAEPFDATPFDASLDARDAGAPDERAHDDGVADGFNIARDAALDGPTRPDAGPDAGPDARRECVLDTDCAMRWPNAQTACVLERCSFLCAPGFGDCDGVEGNGCETDLASVEHCGACGNACPGVNTPHFLPACISGRCMTYGCGGGFLNCDGDANNRCETRVNTLDHCGGCDVRCPSGTTCDGLSCVCPGSQTVCAGACVDTRTSASHCGACGTACASGQTCAAGVCVCPEGLTRCGAGCVDTQTSNTHCGGCNVACTGGKTCQRGACACPTGQYFCGGRCVSHSEAQAQCDTCTTDPCEGLSISIAGLGLFRTTCQASRTGSGTCCGAEVLTLGFRCY